MENQNYQKIEDWLTDEAFCQWLKGEASASDKAYWDQWLAADPNRAILVKQAKTVVKALKNTEINLTKEEIDAEASRILHTIDVVEDPKRVRLIPFWWAAAASLTLLAVAGFWFSGKNKQINTPSPKESQWTVSEAILTQIIDIQSVKTDTTILFSDGSTAQLKRGSSLQYDKNFSGAQRSVTLINGEAFFEVTKNKDKPFVVYANDIVTKVLGTSFTVRTSNNTEGGISSVVVRTGKVVVFKKSDFTKSENETKDSVLLLPNQQVSRKVTVTPLVASLVEIPVLIEKPVENPNFSFDNAPIADILTTLEKAYSVQIEANESILKACRITISLGNQDTLFDKLKVICKVIGAQYEVVDTKIKLTGKGC